MRHRCLATTASAKATVVRRSFSGGGSFTQRRIGVLATVIAVVSLAGGPAACRAPTADTWTPSRTPWGDQDLQGIWSPGYYLTPLERPDEFAGREFLTDEEVAALEKEAEAEPGRDFRPEAGSEADVEGAYNDAFTGRGTDQAKFTHRGSARWKDSSVDGGRAGAESGRYSGPRRGTPGFPTLCN